MWQAVRGSKSENEVVKKTRIPQKEVEDKEEVEGKGEEELQATHSNKCLIVYIFHINVL